MGWEPTSDKSAIQRVMRPSNAGQLSQNLHYTYNPIKLPLQSATSAGISTTNVDNDRRAALNCIQGNHALSHSQPLPLAEPVNYDQEQAEYQVQR